MPLPKPKKGENKLDWMKRCMANGNMREEFPSSEQRAAVCNDLWHKRDKKTVISVIDKTYTFSV